MGWNLALRMMSSHWVFSKQVTCSVLYVKKIALDALFRIGEGIRSGENLGAILGRHETMMACTRWNNAGDKAWLDLESSPFFPKGLPFGGLLPSGEDEMVGLLLCQPAAEL